MSELLRSYATLPDTLYQETSAASFATPKLLAWNQALAEELLLVLPSDTDEDKAKYFSGQSLLPGSVPLAQAYAGHQFGHFVEQLGDGRALLLGEIRDAQGKLQDIQLKGSGTTRFSRQGDGRSPLGPVIREYLISEAMHALSVPTTRSLAMVATGETVHREEPLPGGILTRVAQSHIRVGTFEYITHRGDIEALRALTDFCIQRHAPHLADQNDAYEAFLEDVATKQLSLVAKWMGLGFIHGVMNTDNTTISGQTIDYGPCAFMDQFSMMKVFSSIDRWGRYAYGRQPEIILWNLHNLSLCVLQLTENNMHDAQVKAQKLQTKWQKTMSQLLIQSYGRKLGILDPQESDLALIERLLTLMEQKQLDFTRCFFELRNVIQDEKAQHPLQSLEEGKTWLSLWKERVSSQPQNQQKTLKILAQHNPYLIPRNHWIEQAISDAYAGNMETFEQLRNVYQSPWQETLENKIFAAPPTREQEVKQTFCGT